MAIKVWEASARVDQANHVKYPLRAEVGPELKVAKSQQPVFFACAGRINCNWLVAGWLVGSEGEGNLAAQKFSGWPAFNQTYPSRDVNLEVVIPNHHSNLQRGAQTTGTS
jgi:hypothetical protein